MAPICMDTQNSGYTLIELMIVIGIVGIFLSYAVPGFQNLMSHHRLNAAMSKMSYSIKLARQEASIRHKDVRICASEDGLFCNGKKDFSTGWIIYVDDSKKPFRSPTDELLAQYGPTKNVSIKYNRGREVKLNKFGRVGLNGSINFCPKSNKKLAKRLVIIHSSRIRSSLKGVRCNDSK